MRAVTTTDVGTQQERASLVVLRRGDRPPGIVDRAGITVGRDAEDLHDLWCEPLYRADLRRHLPTGAADLELFVAGVLLPSGAAAGQPT